jgi:L-lysine exporter family protein LysE/ArgO
MLHAWIHGFVLAFGLIIPLGVQNFFIFSQGAVRKRFKEVLPIIITAGICDTLLVLLAVLGVSVVVFSFAWMKTILVVAGFIFLIFMGFVTWRSKGAEPASTETERISLSKTISFTVMISLLNPHAILDTIGIVGISSLNYQGYAKIAFTAACVMVSWSWFFGLALLGRFIGLRDQSGALVNSFNKISAVVMWAAAFYLIYSLIP